MKIALIGSNGLLGSSIKQYLLKISSNSLFLTHKDFEITNIKDYNKLIKYDIIINTAAYLGVEPCENNPNDAFNINIKAVEYLARFCNNNNKILVHISSDSVFDGLEAPYDEDANPKPINMYGLTKYGGEQFVYNICKKYYIFRIPILFGNRQNSGNIFIEKMYNLYLNGHKVLNIADDIISKPSYSLDISKHILDIIKGNKEYGIYHIFNAGEPASLYDFAVEFFKLKNITDITITRAKSYDFSLNEIGLKPLNTTLKSYKNKPLRNWKEAMKEYIKDSNE